MTWTRDLGELYPGFSADMAHCASKAAGAPGHGQPCPLCKQSGRPPAMIQGGKPGMRAHFAVVHDSTISTDVT